MNCPQVVKSGCREKVIELRRNNPCATQSWIGLHCGVSRQRVEQILFCGGLPTSHYRTKYVCANCRKVFSPTRSISMSKIFCCRRCHYEYYNPLTACEWCGKLFRDKGSSIVARANRNKHIFCGDKCNGAYMGKHYGFAAHPENIRRRA